MISVIVPVFNSAQYVGQCIEALLGQQDPGVPYEIILVDNGSSDDSRQIAAAFERVRVLDNPNRSAYAARNTGAHAASGDILAFTDADCAPHPGWLKSLKQALSQPGCLLVQGSRSVAGQGIGAAALNGFENARQQYVMQSEQAELYFGYTNNLALRRSLFEQLGPFEERARGGDTLLVRAVVDAHGCEAVRFCEDMRIEHLEMKSMADFFRKQFIYGRSRQLYSHRVRTRTLSLKERLQLASEEAGAARFRALHWVWLIGGLGGTWLAWQVGAMTGRIQQLGRH